MWIKVNQFFVYNTNKDLNENDLRHSFPDALLMAAQIACTNIEGEKKNFSYIQNITIINYITSIWFIQEKYNLSNVV